MIFDSKKKISAFTLIELMLVISIFMVTILATTQIDFNKISDEQKSEIFAHKIISKIEAVRNNALIGKGIGTSLETPDEWNITISTTPPNLLQVNYNIGGTWTADNSLAVNSDDGYSISELNCYQIDGTSETISGNASIIINKSNLELSGCSDNSYKILEIISSYKNYESVTQINMLSGVIEKK